jgi:hypothetical protein
LPNNGVTIPLLWRFDAPSSFRATTGANLCISYSAPPQVPDPRAKARAAAAEHRDPTEALSVSPFG